MIIPYFNYELGFPTISRKIIFCLLSMILYLIVAMPDTNKYIGSYLELDHYDDTSQNDRYYLWFIHSVVFAIAMYILLMFYNPNPSVHLTTTKISSPKHVPKPTHHA